MNSLSHGLIEEKIEGGFKLFHKNGVYMGDVLMNDDGYYVFFPDDTRKGYWSEFDFYRLYTYLKDKNKAWNIKINEFFR